MRPIALTSAAAAAALGLAILSAAPAVAADLPEDAALYAVTYDTSWALGVDGVLTEVDEVPDTGGKYGAAVDPTTGLGYFFSDGDDCILYSIVVETGEYTEIGVVGAGVPGFDECDAINVDRNGVLRIGDQHGVMITVDKATAATLSTVEIDIEGVSAILQAPDGAFYVTTYFTGLHTLDPGTGATSPVAVDLEFVETAVIDDSGTVWVSSWGDGCLYGLHSFPISDPMSVTFQGNFLSSEVCTDVFAILVTLSAPAPAPVPVLPATGSGAAVALPFAMLALLVGAGGIVLARRTRAA